MKVAVVRLADQFGVKKLKKRPCVIISQSKKHTKVCLYTHKPKFKDYKYGIIFANRDNSRDWLDLNQVFIVRNEYIAYTCETLNPIFEQEVKKTLKRVKGKQTVHCLNYNFSEYPIDK